MWISDSAKEKGLIDLDIPSISIEYIKLEMIKKCLSDNLSDKEIDINNGNIYIRNLRYPVTLVRTKGTATGFRKFNENNVLPKGMRVSPGALSIDVCLNTLKGNIAVFYYNFPNNDENCDPEYEELFLGGRVEFDNLYDFFLENREKLRLNWI